MTGMWLVWCRFSDDKANFPSVLSTHRTVSRRFSKYGRCALCAILNNYVIAKCEFVKARTHTTCHQYLVSGICGVCHWNAVIDSVQNDGALMIGISSKNQVVAVCTLSLDRKPHNVYPLISSPRNRSSHQCVFPSAAYHFLACGFHQSMSVSSWPKFVLRKKFYRESFIGKTLTAKTKRENKRKTKEKLKNRHSIKLSEIDWCGFHLLCEANSIKEPQNQM